MRADNGAERVVQVCVPALPARLKLVRALVAEVAVAAGCSEGCTHDMMLAVDEAVQNVIRHAYGGRPGGEIMLDIRRRGDTLVFDLVDYAAPVDPARVHPRPLEELRPGGLGTHFIRECMDEAVFRVPPEGAGNCLRMVKRIS